MKKLAAKMRKLNRLSWKKLTPGEKILKVVLKLLKLAAVVALVLTVAGTIAVVIGAVAIAFGIANAIAGGFDFMGPDEHYVRFR